MPEFSHTPVLLRETLEALAIDPGGVYVDGTCGGAGHSRRIAQKLKGGFLYCFDKDPDAVAVATERLLGYPAKVIEADFRNACKILTQEGVNRIDGVLLDLGVSAYQLENPDRGFSYRQDGILDMRMSRQGPTARDLVNNLTEKELRDIFNRYGEEKHSSRIAKKIVIRREKSPILTTTRLREIVISSYPPRERRKDRNPCRKVFQALRIAVNDELGALTDALRDFFNILKPGGRIRVITFHSLEDRIVKQYFKSLSAPVVRDEARHLIYGTLARPGAELYTKKPITPSPLECESNRRARSAKLRVLIKA